MLSAYFLNKLDLSKAKNRIIATVVAIIFLFIISSFRYDVGTDYINYYNSYWSIPKGYSKIEEPLYGFFVKILYYFKTGPIYIFVMMSAIFLFCTYEHVFYDSPYTLISIFLIFGCRYYFAFLNIGRQLVASAILVFSIRFIEKDEFVKFVICVFIATGFHYTSIVFLVLYLIRKIKLDIPSVLVLLFVTFVCRELIALIFKNVLINSTYSNYTISNTRTATGLRNIILQFFIYVFSYIFSDNSKKYNIYLNCQILTIITVILSGSISLFERMRYVFCLSNIILLPLAIKNIKDKKLRYISMVALILFFLWYMYQGTVINDMYNVLPYKWYKFN